MTRNERRALNYAKNLSERIGILTADSLKREAPFVIKRTVEITCDEYGKVTQLGPFTRHDYRLGADNTQCKARHRIGKRTWAVVGHARIESGKSPMILDRFNCILMAKALRDDLNFKAGIAIMGSES